MPPRYPLQSSATAEQVGRSNYRRAAGDAASYNNPVVGGPVGQGFTNNMMFSPTNAFPRGGTGDTGNDSFASSFKQGGG